MCFYYLRRIKIWSIACFVALISAAVWGCGDPASIRKWETHSNSVVGGNVETGYPAVGTIVRKQWFNTNSTCTATLIKKDWILTAAHCVDEGIADLEFSIGPEDSSGHSFPLADVFIHPSYYPNPIGSLYDIALVSLAAQVPPSVASPISYSAVSIEPFLGATVLYIGYGSTSGTSSFLGLGVKRSVSLPIERIDLITYSNGFSGSGLCFGNSGGPGLMEIGGQLQVVGITSASLGCQGGACDPCENGSKHTRVDRFSDWIADVVGDSFTSCVDNLDRCVCDLACAGDGICDNALCGTATCGDITDCIFSECSDSSDGSCSTGCIDDGHVEARDQLMLLVDCWAQECPAVVGSDNELQCLLDNCTDEWNACREQVNPEPDPEEPSDTDDDTDTIEQSVATSLVTEPKFSRVEEDTRNGLRNEKKQTPMCLLGLRVGLRFTCELQFG